MSKRKLSEVSSSTRVVVADWVLSRSKTYANLPDVLKQLKPPKKDKDFWFGFGSELHPLALVDENGMLVRSTQPLTETIAWTAVTGRKTEESFTSRADKEGIYWFKKADPYVLGSFCLSFHCIGLTNSQPLFRYLPIVPSPECALDVQVVRDTVANLACADRLEYKWIGPSVNIAFGSARSLTIRRYLWSALRSDQENALRQISFRLPPFRPTVSDIIASSTRKEHSSFYGKVEDGAFFCDTLKTLFDEVFEKYALFPSEREFYQTRGIFIQLKKAGVRVCDAFGGMHLLRFIISLSVVLRRTSSLTNKDASVEQSRPARHRRVSSHQTAPMPADLAHIDYLAQDATVSGLADVLSELENIFPLAPVS